MHVDSGESHFPSRAAHAALWLLVCGAAGCVSKPAPVAEPAPAEAPVEAPTEAPPEAAPAETPAKMPKDAPAPAPPVSEGAEPPPVAPEFVDPETGRVWPGKEEAAKPEPEEPARTEPQAAQEEAPVQESQPGPPAAEPPAEPEPGVEAWVAAPAAPASSGPAEGHEGVPGPGWVHGSLSVRYRGRFTDDDQDQDARGVLALDVVNPEAPWIRGHLLARVDVDIDGLGDDPIFDDLTDTYDGSVVSKLYLAYADIDLDRDPEDSPGTLRVGRQSDARLPEVVRIDGISYLTRPMGAHEVEVGLYGGVLAHLYESSHEGDLGFGTFVEGLPWQGGRARLDWMHLEDELVLGEEHDDLLTVGLWQQLSPRWRLEGEFSHLEGDPRDLRLLSSFDDAESETTVRAAYYELLETQTQRVNELDPFFEQLLEYFPFRQLTLNASHAFGERTVLDAGIDLRRVSDSDDVGDFNRDWERYYATATLRDLATEGLALSATADRWDGDGEDTSSLGADLSYDADEAWQAGIGTYYSLYKYELLELSERDDVRTYYLRVSRELSERLEMDFLYEFEDDDLETYHTLRLGVLWRF